MNVLNVKRRMWDGKSGKEEKVEEGKPGFFPLLRAFPRKIISHVPWSMINGAAAIIRVVRPLLSTLF